MILFFTNLVNANQHIPLTLYGVKIWCILPESSMHGFSLQYKPNKILFKKKGTTQISVLQSIRLYPQISIEPKLWCVLLEQRSHNACISFTCSTKALLIMKHNYFYFNEHIFVTPGYGSLLSLA